MKNLNHKAFTVVEIVIGLAAIVAIIGAGGLIYRRAGGNPFRAGASGTAFNYTSANMTYDYGKTYEAKKVDGITYKILPASGDYTIRTLVSSAQLANVKQICAHYKTFGSPFQQLTILQLSADNRNVAQGLTSLITGSNVSGSFCTNVVTHRGSSSVIVYTQGKLAGTSAFGIDSIYGTL